MQNIPVFEEKQYLGYNKYSIIRRMVLALFCFIAYYWTEEREQNGDLLFLLGISIIVISVVLLFILHLHTRLYEDYLMLDGLWTTKKVKIDLRNMVSVEKVKLNASMINNPVYNLHYKGTIRFFTGGREAVKLTDKDGLIYLIGTQKADELTRLIREKTRN
jgi:hypothetical protein